MRISDWSSDVCSSDLVDEVPHAVHVQLVREQLGPFRRIDTVKAAMPGRWAGDPHVDLARTCVTHHLHDIQRGRAAHDAVIDKANAFAVAEGTVCIVLPLHDQMADLVTRREEGSAKKVAQE